MEGVRPAPLCSKQNSLCLEAGSKEVVRMTRNPYRCFSPDYQFMNADGSLVCKYTVERLTSTGFLVLKCAEKVAEKVAEEVRLVLTVCLEHSALYFKAD